MRNYQTANLAHSLERIADSYQQDADALRDFARQLREAPETDYSTTPLHSNVVTLLGRVMNNSSWIAAAGSALHTSAELVRGVED